MADNQDFRPAFNGFNREDVVNYIAQTTNQNDTIVSRLKEQLERVKQERDALQVERDVLRAERDELRGRSDTTAAAQAECKLWQEKFQAMQQENESLQQLLEEQEHSLSQLRQRLETITPEQVLNEDRAARRKEELEAYRRAENAERRALSRVNLMYDRASGVLSDVDTLMNENARRIGDLAKQLGEDLAQLQAAISDSENTMATASNMIREVRPERDALA